MIWAGVGAVRYFESATNWLCDRLRTLSQAERVRDPSCNGWSTCDLGVLLLADSSGLCPSALKPIGTPEASREAFLGAGEETGGAVDSRARSCLCVRCLFPRRSLERVHPILSRSPHGACPVLSSVVSRGHRFGRTESARAESGSLFVGRGGVETNQRHGTLGFRA